jgi:cell division protein FtsL
MSRFTQTLFTSVKKTKTVAAFLARNVMWVNLTLFVMVVSCSLAYVVRVNTSATKGYQIRDLENAISRLQLENQSMQVKIAEVRSMENVAAKVPMLGMTKAEAPVYLSGYPATVSLNR